MDLNIKIITLGWTNKLNFKPIIKLRRELKIIKPEGKNIMTGEEFLRGRSHLIYTLLS